MGCAPCKKKKELTTLPPPTEIDVESILKSSVELSQPDSIDVPPKKRGRPASSKTIIRETTTEEVQPVKNYMAVDDYTLLDKYFGAKDKRLLYDSANIVFRKLFNEDIAPGNCRGCEGRSWRKWIEFKNNLK